MMELVKLGDVIIQPNQRHSLAKFIKEYKLGKLIVRKEELAVCVCSEPTRKSLLDIQGYAECILKTSKSVVGDVENVENKAEDKKIDIEVNEQKRIKALNNLFCQLLNKTDKNKEGWAIVGNDFGKLAYYVVNGIDIKSFYVIKIGNYESVYIRIQVNNFSQLIIDDDIKYFFTNQNNSLNSLIDKDLYCTLLKNIILLRISNGTI